MRRTSPAPAGRRPAASLPLLALATGLMLAIVAWPPELPPSPASPASPASPPTATQSRRLTLERLRARPHAQHNCRFWGSLAARVPAPVIIEHLIKLPHSLENLSPGNPNGWSVGWYAGCAVEPILRRGQPAAHLDSLFDVAVIDAAAAHPHIGISHIRNCSSGSCDIPNPHPFARMKHGTHWLMAHNGSIDLAVLIELIRPEFLQANPPRHGEEPEEWIDSEFYFIYMLQTFEDHDWQIKPALGEVVQRLRERIEGTSERLNFVLSDGRTLWSYRQGSSLFYYHDDAVPAYAVVASLYPTSQQDDWIVLEDGDLVTLVEGEAPLIERIELYFDPPTSVAEHAAVSGVDRCRLQASPNPFSISSAIGFDLSAAERVTLEIYDVRGRLARVLAGRSPYAAGRHVLHWDGTDMAGREMSAGIYFCHFQAGAINETRRLVHLR